MPHSKPTPILLVNDSWYSVLAAVRALRTAGYAPWLAVNEPGTYAVRSRAKAGTVPVPDPSLDSEGFVRELAAAAAQLSAAAVLPTADHHLLILAGREAAFARERRASHGQDSASQACRRCGAADAAHQESCPRR